MKILIAKNENLLQYTSSITSLIKSGFKQKFQSFKFNDEEIELLVSSLASYILEFQSSNLIIAKEENEICGCLLIGLEESNLFEIISFLKEKVSLSLTVRFLMFLCLLSHKPKSDEVYIDFLVVSSEFRGLGIGTSLLNEAKKIVPENKGLTLYVAKDNQRAYNLYRREGFEEVKVEQSFLREKFIGFRSWVFMESR